ncbi:ATP-dependent DNA ligase domain-containing protein [Besnoitia besnoiti]|uniref:DNA ligase IV n=1 Tax=Besnoitia besnoiti TaxID=94643 RepID=A0A2A9MQV9_BESBE|nr:ATP-dependent DNA ligase domain-containing protein [Besnoitia besnoiti]PFH38757.1 ATP-dependent DNA ligase domain-containing protein [Besnoitia besnoiti]
MAPLLSAPSRRSVSTCEDLLFADVCKVLERLTDPFSKPANKLHFFARYLRRFSHLPAGALYPLLRLFLPQLDRRRPPSQLKQPLLARVYAQIFALPPAAAARLRLYKDPAAAVAASVATAGTVAAKVGDFGSFVAATVKQRVGRRPGVVTVGQLNRELDLVALASSTAEKTAILQGLLPRLMVDEHKWCMRILMKEVKLGGLSGERLLTLLHPDARKIINRCSDLKSTLDVIEEENTGDQADGVKKERRVGEEEGQPERGQNLRLLFQPLRPMLAQLVRPVASDIRIELFGEDGSSPAGDRRNADQQDDDGLHASPSRGVAASRSPSPSPPVVPRLYFMERKYDGERLLAHIDKTLLGSSRPTVRLFSRRGKDYTARYGGEEAADSQPHVPPVPFASRPAPSPSSSSLAVGDTHVTLKCERRSQEEKTEIESKQFTGETGGVSPACERDSEETAKSGALRGLASLLFEALRGAQAILDGELLAWDNELGTFLPFGTNKSVAAAETARCHLSYVVFDVLYYRNHDGQEYSLLNMQLKDRKVLLERILRLAGNRIMLAPFSAATRANQVIDALNVAIENRHEGIVVKDAHSFYHLHSRRGGWYKLKPHLGSLPDTLDVIVIGGFFAQGPKRRDFASAHLIDHCSHFLLGVLEGDGGAEAKRVKSFCKVGTGFSFSTLADIRNFLRPHCQRFQEADPPEWLRGCKFNANTRMDVTWPPWRSFVMEVRGAELLPGAEFDVGATLRFPVAVRPFRRDKAWYEAMSEHALHDFFALAEERGGRLLSQAFSRSRGEEREKEKGVADGAGRPSLERGRPRGDGAGPFYQNSDEGSEAEGDTSEEERGVEDEDGEGGGATRRTRLSDASFGDRHEGGRPAFFSAHHRSQNLLHHYSFSLRPGEALPSPSASPARRSPGAPRPQSLSAASSFSPLALLAPFRSTDTSRIEPCSSALGGTKMWIVSGDEDAFPKASLEALVAHMGGRVSQTLSPSVSHIIAAGPTFRTRAIAAAASQLAEDPAGKRGSPFARKRKRPSAASLAAAQAAGSRESSSATSPLSSAASVASPGSAASPLTRTFAVPPRVPPVVHFRWLLECAENDTLVPLRPSLVIHGTPETEREFARQFDAFGDAYFEAEPPTERGRMRLLELLQHAVQVAGKSDETAVQSDARETEQAKGLSRQQREDGEEAGEAALNLPGRRGPRGRGVHDDRSAADRELRGGNRGREAEQTSFFVSGVDASDVDQELREILRREDHEPGGAAKGVTEANAFHSMRLYVEADDIAWTSPALQPVKQLLDGKERSSDKSGDCWSISTCSHAASPRRPIPHASSSDACASASSSDSGAGPHSASLSAELCERLEIQYRASLVALCSVRGARYSMYSCACVCPPSASLVASPTSATHILLAARSSAQDGHQVTRLLENQDQEGGEETEWRSEGVDGKGVERGTHMLGVGTEVEPEGERRRKQRTERAQQGAVPRPQFITEEMLAAMLSEDSLTTGGRDDET